jgi:TldD protein
MIPRTSLVFVLILLLLALPLPLLISQNKVTQPSFNDDPVLSAMRSELERSKLRLKMDGVAAPYYIDYRVVDMDAYAAEAAFGGLRVSTRTHSRFLRVTVRIGDYKQDSFFGQGQGLLDLMPIEDNVFALRHQIWLATDSAYKAAAQALTAKQAQLKQYSIDEPVQDFAHAEPVVSVRPLAKLDFDPLPWLTMVKDASALYQDDPQIESSDSGFAFTAVNRYFVNSEGTTVRSGRILYDLHLAGSTQAADGMRLARAHADITSKFAELPSHDAFMSHARELFATLKHLREAPLVDEEYRGPVLFSADAASTVFSDLIGENLLGLKPDLGQPARTKGEFATSYKARVLPEFLSVVDDPTLFSIAGRSLIGNYEVDDEGVKAMRVSLIEEGKLANYLMGREPIRDFPASNGHGRAQLPQNYPGPSLGNLIVRSSQPLGAADLQKKLTELCRQQDLPFGYFAETLGPKLTPRLFYKVWVNDGRKELVRGAAFADLNPRALRNDLVAAGDDVSVENRIQNVPHSLVNPSILVDNLEVKRANTNKEKLPEYPPPQIISGN